MSAPQKLLPTVTHKHVNSPHTNSSLRSKWAFRTHTVVKNSISSDLVESYLNDHPDYLEKYIMKHISLEKLHQWLQMKSETPEKRIFSRTSKNTTEDNSNQKPIIVKLIENMQSNSVNSDSVKPRGIILTDLVKHISKALSCDGSKLYLVDDTNCFIYYYNPDKQNRMKDSCVVKKIDKGTTIAAYVAHTKQTQRIADIVSILGTNTNFPEGVYAGSLAIHSVLTLPILLACGKLIGVCEFYRNSSRSPFSWHDEDIATNFVLWAGLALIYIDKFYNNIKQDKLNIFILDVVRNLFKNLDNMQLVIIDIMVYAKSLVNADRATLYITDFAKNEIYSHIFDKGHSEDVMRSSEGEFEIKECIRFPMDKGIAGYVARTGETVSINDPYSDPRFNRAVDETTGYTTKSILCMPVRLHDEDIIGVVQMLNKLVGNFTEQDYLHFSTFATYCGLALHISKMYETIYRSEKKYKVALEVLSYHSRYTMKEFNDLKSATIPEFIEGFSEFRFSPWSVDASNKPIYFLYMVADLFGLTKTAKRTSRKFSRVSRFDFETLLRFILTVRKNYRRVPYHNWAHAFSVTHAMYCVLKLNSHKFTFAEQVAMLVSSLCHDIDHRGKTNEYVTKSNSPLALLYSTSVMEYHHFKITVMILQREGHNIFETLNSVCYKQILGHIKHCILATDLVNYFQYKTDLENILTKSKKGFNFDNEKHRLTLMALCLTTCDLCTMYKPWKTQVTLVMIIMEEFWIQGDDEKEKGETPLRMMDRDYKHELPKCQVGFIRGICLPCFTVIGKILPEIKTIVKAAKSNLRSWEMLVSLPKEELLKELEYFERGKDILSMH